MAAGPKDENISRKAAPLSDEEVSRLRKDFPVLGLESAGSPLVYLDSATTSQKPQAVIEALAEFYRSQNANVHRGVHRLSQAATAAYEGARKRVAAFLGAGTPDEIVFTRGTTEAINLVAQTYGRRHVGPGDEIVVSAMEHHSNIVPWQLLCEENGAALRVVPINDDGELMFEAFEALLNERTRLVSITHVSNALGTVNPVKRVIERAHAAGVPVLLDGAQSAPHRAVNVAELDCDFFACSGHKMFGPTGIGVLYGKREHLETMPPYQAGGEMVLSVEFERSTYQAPPHRFEAGTPAIAGAIGLGAAVDYLSAVGMGRIAAYERGLLEYGTDLLLEADVRLIGTAKEKAGILSFHMDCAHPHDIAQILDDEGVCIRAGHHCAQPALARFGLSATARASIAFYNTKEDLDALGAGLEKVKRVFG
ncbi:MAG TPA: cysteine desulfurase [Candidatus Hydrogenedentes bacterium]|nr:cysteine desulfurase [Candidatus Hydrogenedentota bacterium]